MPAGLAPKPSWVKVTQVGTLALERIGPPFARLPEPGVRALLAALNVVLS